MDFNKVLQVLLKVLTDYRLIFICVIVILYLNFMVFVTNYRRKIRTKKKRKIIAPPPPKEKKKGDDAINEDDESESGEET